MCQYLNTVSYKNARHTWYHEVANQLPITDLELKETENDFFSFNISMAPVTNTSIIKTFR
jgi:hypothetical protein